MHGLSILLTGGTGSFGQACTRILLEESHPETITIFSRDEWKQHEMCHMFPEAKNMRYFIGDVRDPDRLRRAMNGVDVVIHAAALKQVPACEYNPFEAVQTNIIGARNIIDAALDAGVRKVMALSTDKAVNPVNLYGATKLVAEKVFVQGNAYTGTGNTHFSCVRYGNVLASRGSVVPLFLRQRATGRVTVTDPRMTRFWITLEQGVRFVLRCIGEMRGAEIFVPKIPSMRITDLAEAVAPGCRTDFVGVRPGEKLHEVLLSPEEARHAVETDDMYVIQPESPFWPVEPWPGGRIIPDGFRYSSDANDAWISADELRSLLGAEALQSRTDSAAEREKRHASAGVSP